MLLEFCLEVGLLCCSCCGAFPLLLECGFCSLGAEGEFAFDPLVCAPFLHISHHGPFSHVMLNDVKFDGRAAYLDAGCADFFLDLDGLLVLVDDDMCSSTCWNVSEFQASCDSVHSGNSQRGKEDTKSKATSQSPLVSSIPQVWFESLGDMSLFSVFHWLLAGTTVCGLGLAEHHELVDETVADGMANEAKENPRDSGSAPPIAEAVGSPGTCKKGQVSTEGSSSRAVAMKKKSLCRAAKDQAVEQASACL